MSAVENVKNGLVKAIDALGWANETDNIHVLRDDIKLAKANMKDALSIIQQLEREREPRAHGSWKWKVARPYINSGYYCTVCNAYLSVTGMFERGPFLAGYIFCPYCGAEMEE